MSQLLSLNVTKRDEQRKNLLKSFLYNRVSYFYSVTGKDRDREACHAVLVDINKKQQFLEKLATGNADVANYGIILKSAWGHETSLSTIKDITERFENDIEKKLVCVKLHKDGCDQVYYTLSDVARENDFIIASSEEEVRQIGKILCSTRDEEPAESLSTVIEKAYFGLAEHNSIYNELFDSVRKGELQRVTTYLDEGGDVNSADEYGQSLMHHAALSGKVNLVQYLKEKGANVHAEDKLYGRKPVHIAAKEGHPTVVSYFLKNGANESERDQNNWTPLHYAVWGGHSNTIRLLIEEHGADISATAIFMKKAPIHIAAANGDVHVIKYLIEKRASIESEDERCRTPLYYSVMEGHYEMFNYLIENNANINVRNNYCNRTLLHVSVFMNNKEIITDLIKAGIEINARQDFGYTPLLLAATNYKLNSLIILADLGADLFAVNDDGKNALDLSKEHADMILHIVYRMCKKQQEEGNYCDALKLYTQYIDSIKTLRQDNPEYMDMQNNLGIMLYEMGHFDEAADILRYVLRNRELFFGLNHLSTLNTKHRLALVYNAQLNHIEALALLKQVLKAMNSTMGEDHDNSLNIAYDLGLLYFKMGEYDEALRILEHVFERRSQNFGSEDHRTLQARQEMAMIFVNKGEIKKALWIFKDILKIRTEHLGNNHQDTLSTSYHVKLISEKVEKLAQGQSYVSQIIDCVKQIFL